MQRLINILFAAIKSEHLELDDLKHWADRCIEEIEHPVYLLIDLSMTSSRQNALNSLIAVLPEYGGICGEYYGELLLGFLFLRFRKSGGDLDEFATACIDVMDIYYVLGGPSGTEFVEGKLADEFVEALGDLARESEENLRRVLDLRFDASERKALHKQIER